MVNYWRLVNKVIKEADILLLILDARMPKLTRNREIEEKIRQNKKQIIYVLNKCDLVEKNQLDDIKKGFDPCVFVSSTQKLGGTLLFKKILELSKGEDCIVGVLGYPNTGKSSVINLINGKKAASTSSYSGHTRGVQFVKAKGKIKLIDTPGVLQFNEKDIEKKILIGVMNPQHVKEPDFYAMLLIEKKPEIFEKYFDIKYGDGTDFLEKLALKQNVLIKGGLPDTKRIGRKILQDWQQGKIHEFLLK
ncbi:GTPase RsgA [archaeon]|jgi:ribosome biogenesis GTPase A|nr:GTPase RsgA [archaeon]MBT4022524.1 GTPase RsgA [archaeon]MBT4272850.1 GTPase RsgA [archaeon]MBT4461650.1 GTPase RsgA [archaeon]MBT4857582.1 GTPase RsgA [archaeon]